MKTYDRSELEALALKEIKEYVHIMEENGLDLGLKDIPLAEQDNFIKDLSLFPMIVDSIETRLEMEEVDSLTKDVYLSIIKSTVFTVMH